jgi:hypothetical protein
MRTPDGKLLYFYGLATGLQDVEPSEITAWAYEFLPLLADRCFWGYGMSTRRIAWEFQTIFPMIFSDEEALEIVRHEVGPKPEMEKKP